jgi:nitrite reductase (NADH) small subunit
MTTLTTAPPVDDVVAPLSRTVIRPGVLPPPGAKQWVPACPVSRLVPGRVVAVLLPGGGQAALFQLPHGMIYAGGNIDPYARAGVS